MLITYCWWVDLRNDRSKRKTGSKMNGLLEPNSLQLFIVNVHTLKLMGNKLPWIELQNFSTQTCP